MVTGLVGAQVWGSDIDIEQVLAAGELQRARLRQCPCPGLQNVGDVFGAECLEGEPVGDGPRHLVSGVDLGQRQDFAQVIAGVEPALLQAVVIGLRIRRQRQEAQHQALFPGAVALGDESLGVIGVLDILVTAIAARMAGDELAIEIDADPVRIPETADELCAVAADLGAAPGEVYLGARATEALVKRLSQTGELAQFRIVHFATHGALAGQVRGTAEPGLLLTPPDSPSEEDDGYLTASEIAGLKLDADWAILSACNTAAGGAQGAEALSGLARAFIYAQARALLVSHWEVNSAATVKLITGATSRLAADRAMGRAEAMRQSMLALIDKGTPQEAHPAYWAPFVVVGEGGAGR